MEATLEKIMQIELPVRETFSADVIELTLNSKFDFHDAKVVSNYRQWKKF